MARTLFVFRSRRGLVVVVIRELNVAGCRLPVGNGTMTAYSVRTHVLITAGNKGRKQEYLESRMTAGGA